MAPIVATAEITRSPDDVFAYVTDPTRLAEWQESVVRSEPSETPVRVGTRARVTRRVGRREMTLTAEVSELTPPTSWKVRGIDGPVRGDVNGRIEPLDGATRSRVTIELDLHGHGLGKLLVPLIVRRQAQDEMPRNMQRLKQRLEENAVTSELRAVEGEGGGRITVTLTGRDKPNLSSEVEVNVHGLPGDKTFEVSRAFDTNADGECTSTNWLPLGSITTNGAGSGTAHFTTNRGAPFVSGFEFDILYQVMGDGIKLRSTCLTLTIK